MKFCENKLCRFHLESEPGQNRMQYRPLSEDFETIEVRQLTIRDARTRREFRFCEICANAVALVNEQPKNEHGTNTDER